MSKSSFGRRATAAPSPRASLPVMTKAIRPGAPEPAAPKVAPPNSSTGPSVDDELRAWKKSRGSHFPIKLLSLVASVSFGVASIALPAQINDWAQYPLYALSAASLYAGFRKRKAPDKIQA